jgi:hypothetical protein
MELEELLNDKGREVLKELIESCFLEKLDISKYKRKALKVQYQNPESEVVVDITLGHWSEGEDEEKQ